MVSPNGDGYADLPTVSYVLSQKALVTATLSTEDGAWVVTLFQDQSQSARRQRFAWPMDTVPDGRYRLTISARTDGGRMAAQSAELIVVRTLGFVAVSPPVFSPDGDGVADTVTIAFSLTKDAHVAVEVRQDGVTVALLFVGVLGPGQQSFLWDGGLPTGRLGPGRYEVAVTATDAIATVTQAVPVEVAAPP